MDLQHFLVLIRCSPMGMHNSHTGNKHCPIQSVHSPCDVNIFRIHKKPFVKQSHLSETFRAEEHETALMIRHIHLPLVVVELQLIAYVHFLHYSLRKETAEYQIGRSGKQTTGILLLSIRIYHIRLYLSHIRMRIHIFYKIFQY